jgi:hypothetical protein
MTSVRKKTQAPGQVPGVFIPPMSSSERNREGALFAATENFL